MWLLSNALRHTPTGGHVDITVTTTRETVSCQVTDNGAGIPADALPHVFERFYRADPSRNHDTGGSGLGLTIARALVRAHHGTIAASSPGPGGGTCFTVTLPHA
jgi:signal transduction histidine kinase